VAGVGFGRRGDAQDRGSRRVRAGYGVAGTCLSMSDREGAAVAGQRRAGPHERGSGWGAGRTCNGTCPQSAGMASAGSSA
jgi:hypothetical protein